MRFTGSLIVAAVAARRSYTIFTQPLGRARTPAEQVTYSIDEAGAAHVLRIEWGTKSATIPFTVGQ